MLPTGHIAAGYLVAEGVLRAIKPDLEPGQFNQLLFWGAFFGFCPDLDMFYAFFKARGFTLPRKKINHRSYIPHLPAVWLVIGLGIYFLSSTPFWNMFGLMVWLGTWSHFLLDSYSVGIKWLWPFSNKFFAFKSPGEREEGPDTSFFGYWIWFLEYYTRKGNVTFYLEILILLVAAAVFWISPLDASAHTVESNQALEHQSRGHTAHYVIYGAGGIAVGGYAIYLIKERK